jgi:PAS domain-containing protein
MRKNQSRATLIRLALEATPVPLWIGDENLMIVFMNDALADLVGVRRQDFEEQKSVDDLVLAARPYVLPALWPDFYERQRGLSEGFRRGQWHRGEAEVTFYFDPQLRPGGRSGQCKFRILAKRVVRDGKSVGAISLFMELPS